MYVVFTFLYKVHRKEPDTAIRSNDAPRNTGIQDSVFPQMDLFKFRICYLEHCAEPLFSLFSKCPDQNQIALDYT